VLSWGLSIGFETAKYTQAIIVGQEFGVVWEVVNKPVARDTDEYSGQTFLWNLSATASHDKKVYCTKMKIQAHPGLPPIPSICAIAAASKPPKLPASAAAEKKMADRIPNSLRLYQQER
jgi:hypothetical protein